MEHLLDEISRRPDLFGAMGRAWRLRPEECAPENNTALEDWPLVIGWLVEAPSYNPIFHSYLIEVLDLDILGRVQGDDPPVILVPNAKYELKVWSLRPDISREQFLIDGGVPQDDNYCQLAPVNYCQQFVDTLESLKARMTLAVMGILDGRINPDTDGQRTWITMYGDDMAQRKLNS